jgi:hypothetical protein
VVQLFAAIVHFETLILRPALGNAGVRIDVAENALGAKTLCVADFLEPVPPLTKSDGFKASRLSFVCRISENHFTELRISRAYSNLVRIPLDDAAIISLGRIGNCEIRMHRAPKTGGAKEALFTMEFFDHDAQLSIDSRVCHDIADGAAAFEDYASR